MLREYNLSVFCKPFFDTNINGEMLIDLDREDLNDLTNAGTPEERDRLFKLVDSLARIAQAKS